MAKPTSVIKCGAVEGKEIDIDVNFRMWPCCLYQNIFAEFGETGDPFIDALPKDWNDVRIHGIDGVLRHEAFTTHWNDKTWNTKSCSPVCYNNCKATGGAMLLNKMTVNPDE